MIAGFICSAGLEIVVIMMAYFSGRWSTLPPNTLPAVILMLCTGVGFMGAVFGLIYAKFNHHIPVQNSYMRGGVFIVGISLLLSLFSGVESLLSIFSVMGILSTIVMFGQGCAFIWLSQKLGHKTSTVDV